MSILPFLERWRPTLDWAFSWVLRLVALAGCATEVWVDKFHNGTVLIPLATLAGLPDFLGLMRLVRRAVEDDRRVESRLRHERREGEG